MFHVLAAALLLSPQEKDPLEETDLRPDFHVAAAELAESNEESSALALYHWERVLDCCTTIPENRLRARKALARLHPKVPPNKDPKLTQRWRVLGVMFGGVNWKDDVNKLSARYRVSNATAMNVRRGFDAFCKRVSDVSRGHMKIEGKFMALDEEAKNLTVYGKTAWMYPDNYETNRGPKIKDNEFDLVIVYVISNDPLPWDRELYVHSYRYHGATYANFALPDPSAAENAATGGREFGIFSDQIRNAVVNRGGFPQALLPTDSDEDDRVKEDRCFGGNRRIPNEYAEHLLQEHITSLMWRESGASPPANAPFIRNWLVNGPFDNTDDKGFDRPYVNETEPDLSLKDWTPYASKGDFVDFKTRYRVTRGSIMYAATYVYARKKGWLRLSFGVDACAKIFWDGTPVYGIHRHKDGTPDQNAVRFFAEEGRHLLLFKLENDISGYTNEWGLYARFLDPQGGAPRIDVAPVRK